MARTTTLPRSFSPKVFAHLTDAQVTHLHGLYVDEYERVRDENEGSRVAARAEVGHPLTMIEDNMRERGIL